MGVGEAARAAVGGFKKGERQVKAAVAAAVAVNLLRASLLLCVCSEEEEEAVQRGVNAILVLMLLVLGSGAWRKAVVAEGTRKARR